MPMRLWCRIADSLARQIADGVYAEGDRLPSIRDARAHFKVSISTIQKAYGELENRRLAEARPQSGYYVLAREQEGPDRSHATAADTELAEPVSVNQGVFHLFSHEKSDGLINLGPAYPHADLLPVTALQRILRRLTRHHLENILTPDGTVDIDLRLRRQLAQRMMQAGCEIGQDEVVTTAGCKDALALSLGAIVHRGDIVAVETPTFPGFLQLLEVLGAKALEIPTDPVEGISIEALELALEQWPVKAAVLTPTCQNPLGFTMPEARRKRLVVLAHKARLPIIEDDIYGDLGANGPRPPALKSFDRDGLVLYCSSVSKSLGGGLRVGWTVPGQFIDEVRRLKALHGVADNALSAMVVAEFLAGGGYDRHLRRLVQRYAENVRRLAAAVRRSFPEGTHVLMPTGGYVLWVRLPDGIESWALYRAAMARNISFLPGRLFSPSLRYPAHFRLSAAMPVTERIETAVATLGRLAHDLLSAK